ncbi:MAG: nucleotidyltransferase [Deltaproteobacteria bacterium]|nr:nucleotidyltransferase [Deltaproteobacteria bacterium]
MHSRQSDFERDFRDILKCLNAAGCRYVLVGAQAMAAWGYIRATGDLDLFFEPSKTNALKLWKALVAFGAPLSGIKVKDFAVVGTLYQIGVAPVRIDFLNCIDGVSFAQAHKGSRKITLLGQSCRVLSLRHLIKNKALTGRPQDKIDVKRLRELQRTHCE